MLGRVRSIGIALAVAAAGVVPAGVAHADFEPVAVISPSPGPAGVVGCKPGTDAYFYATRSYDPLGNEGDGRMYYSWSWPGGAAEGGDLSIPCDFKGEIEVSLTVKTTAGSGTTTVRVRPNLDPNAVISLDGRPLVQEPYVASGSTVTLSAQLSSDPEGGALKYRWFSSSGRLVGDTSQPTIDVTCDEYEASMTVELTVYDDLFSDAMLSYDEREIAINCTPAPTAAFTPAPVGPGERTKVPLGTTITFETALASVSTLAWRTTGVKGVASDERRFTRKFDTVGDFGVQLTETSPLGTTTRWAGYTVVAPPTVSVTPAPPGLTDRLTIEVGSKITFDGSGTRSPGGAALTYQWRTTGKRGVVSKATSYTRSFDAPGSYGVELTVTDELGQTSKRWVGLTVVSADPPVAKVTPAPANPRALMTVKRGSKVTFDGSGSTSPSGSALSFQWRTTGVTGTAATTKTYTRRFDRVGNFGVELIVTDASGKSAKRWVGITVVP